MQLFPQFDPWNVWDLPVDLWEAFAAMTDEWVAKQREAAAHG